MGKIFVKSVILEEFLNKLENCVGIIKETLKKSLININVPVFAAGANYNYATGKYTSPDLPPPAPKAPKTPPSEKNGKKKNILFPYPNFGKNK